MILWLTVACAVLMLLTGIGIGIALERRRALREHCHEVFAEHRRLQDTIKAGRA